MPAPSTVHEAQQYLLHPPADVQADHLQAVLDLLSTHHGITYAQSSTGIWVGVDPSILDLTGPFGSRLEAQYATLASHLNRVS